MLRQFSLLTKSIPAGVDRERWLKQAIRRAMAEYD